MKTNQLLQIVKD